MAQVQTVTGPVDADDLGKTLIHEHFRGRDEAATYQWPHLHDEEAEYREAVESAQAVLGHGVKTVVRSGADVPRPRRRRSCAASPRRPA